MIDLNNVVGWRFIWKRKREGRNGREEKATDRKTKREWTRGSNE